MGFILVPVYTDDNLKEINSAKAVAGKYSVEFIDLRQPGLVSFDTDYYDPESHLNPSGARKVTDYVGEILSSRYSIPDHRSDPDYETWNSDYIRYIDYKTENLRTCRDLDVYLMLLADRHLNITMQIENPKILDDEVIKNLLENLGVAPGEIRNSTRSIRIEQGDAKVSDEVRPVDQLVAKDADLIIAVSNADEPENMADAAYFRMSGADNISYLDPDSSTYHSPAVRLDHEDE